MSTIHISSTPPSKLRQLSGADGLGSVNRSAQLRHAERAPVSDDRQLRLALAPTEDRPPELMTCPSVASG